MLLGRDFNASQAKCCSLGDTTGIGGAECLARQPATDTFTKPEVPNYKGARFPRY